MEALRSLKGMRGASIISFPAPLLLPEWIWACSYVSRWIKIVLEVQVFELLAAQSVCQHHFISIHNRNRTYYLNITIELEYPAQKGLADGHLGYCLKMGIV